MGKWMLTPTSLWTLLAFLTGLIVPREGAADQIRVACVGDSITVGAGLKDPGRESYPAVLQRLLGPGFEVRNFGVSGATALRESARPYWQLPELEAARRFRPDVVVLLLGTNDAHPRHRAQWDQFERDLRDLGRQFAELENRPVLVLGLPPPCHGLFEAVRERALQQKIRPAIRRVAAAEGWRLADLHTPLMNRPDWLPDGVHPQASGAAAISREVYEQVLAVFCHKNKE